MRPDKALFGCLFLLLPLAVTASYFTVAAQMLAAASLLLLLYSLCEWFIVRRASQSVIIERQLTRSLSLDVWSDVTLKIHNQSKTGLSLEVHDMHPPEFQFEGLPQSITLAQNQRGTVLYRIKPQKRGDYTLAATDCRFRGKFSLWQYRRKIPCTDTVKVYPNFAAQKHYSLLGASHQSHFGIQRKQQRGEGNDFHQLREFRDGDPLRAIDWKATSRIRKLIAREYQQERDQQIVVLLDCGRRMTHSDSGLSHLDETLNSVLLLAHLAIKQGDAVGMMTFGGIDRWLAPAKGNKASRSLLHNLYDLYPTRSASDFRSAASQLVTRLKRRAMVVVVTNTRNEESDELTAAISLLKKRHLVVVADLRESSIDEISAARPTTLEQSLTWLGASNYMAEREYFHERLRGHGAMILDVLPKQLTGMLVNQYYEIKRLGRL